jgi:hypothetical protein
MTRETYHFLTPGQRRFVEAVCDLTAKALSADADGEHVIDMDQIADHVASTSKRPGFYYTEESQQNHYTCAACGGSDDILGRYGYCSTCGTRNDLQELGLAIEGINAKTRERIKVGNRWSKQCVTRWVPSTAWLASTPSSWPSGCPRGQSGECSSKVPCSTT